MMPFEAMRFRKPSGGGGVLDTQTVTVAQTGSAGSNNRIRGYKSTATAQGSISDGTSNIFGGGAITEMFYDEASGGEFYLTITGSTNASWTTLTNVTDGTSLTRAAATFSGGRWTWTAQTLGGFFGSTSGSKTIRFT